MKSAISRSFDQQSPAPTPPYGLRKDGRGKRLKFEHIAPMTKVGEPSHNT